MSAPTTPIPSLEPTQSEAGLLLDAAARLLERRMVAIRSGTAPLHVLLELEQAARAIRALSTDVVRLEGPAAGRDARLPMTLRGPPVLQRVSQKA